MRILGLLIVLMTLLSACGEEAHDAGTGEKLTAAQLRALRSQDGGESGLGDSEEETFVPSGAGANPDQLEYAEDSFEWAGSFGSKTPTQAVEQYLRALKTQDQLLFLGSISERDYAWLGSGEREKLLEKATLRRKYGVNSQQVKEMGDYELLALVQSGMSWGVGRTDHDMRRTFRRGDNVIVETQLEVGEQVQTHHFYCRLQSNGWKIALSETLADASRRHKARLDAAKKAGEAVDPLKGVNE